MVVEWEQTLRILIGTWEYLNLVRGLRLPLSLGARIGRNVTKEENVPSPNPLCVRVYQLRRNAGLIPSEETIQIPPSPC